MSKLLQHRNIIECNFSIFAFQSYPPKSRISHILDNLQTFRAGPIGKTHTGAVEVTGATSQTSTEEKYFNKL